MSEGDPVLSGGNLGVSSGVGGCVTLTLAASGTAESPVALACKELQFFRKSGGNVFFTFSVGNDGLVQAATVNDWPVSVDKVAPNQLPLENMNQVSFIGTIGDVILLMWRR